MSKTASNVTELLKGAHKEGDLSAASMQALTANLDIGAQIQAGLGIGAEDVQSSEVVLVTMQPDDSGSIRFGGNAQAIRDGHNEVIKALQASKQKDSVLAHNRFLNGEVLYPYVKLDDTILMTDKNYDPNKGTPLYDQAIVLLGTVLAKTKEFADNGIPVRTVTLLMTDGADLHSHGRAKDVKALVDDMLRKETHIIGGMAFHDGTSAGGVDCKQVFREMGIRDEWILTPKTTPSEIRKAFQLFSQSAVRASQNAASFSKTALGGFATP
jgi:hypothetical protein